MTAHTRGCLRLAGPERVCVCVHVFFPVCRRKNIKKKPAGSITMPSICRRNKREHVCLRVPVRGSDAAASRLLAACYRARCARVSSTRQVVRAGRPCVVCTRVRNHIGNAQRGTPSLYHRRRPVVDDNLPRFSLSRLWQTQQQTHARTRRSRQPALTMH